MAKMHSFAVTGPYAGADQRSLYVPPCGSLEVMSDDPSMTPRTRDELLGLIAAAIRLQLTYLPLDKAEAIADTVLRTMKQAGLSIRRQRTR
jgi:hypothetical protein